MTTDDDGFNEFLQWKEMSWTPIFWPPRLPLRVTRGRAVGGRFIQNFNAYLFFLVRKCWMYSKAFLIVVFLIACMFPNMLFCLSKVILQVAYVLIFLYFLSNSLFILLIGKLLGRQLQNERPFLSALFWSKCESQICILITVLYISLA